MSAEQYNDDNIIEDVIDIILNYVRQPEFAEEKAPKGLILRKAAAYYLAVMNALSPLEDEELRATRNASAHAKARGFLNNPFAFQRYLQEVLRTAYYQKFLNDSNTHTFINTDIPIVQRRVQLLDTLNSLLASWNYPSVLKHHEKCLALLYDICHIGELQAEHINGKRQWILEQIVDKNSQLYHYLKQFQELRDELLHPKTTTTVFYIMSSLKKTLTDERTISLFSGLKENINSLKIFLEEIENSNILQSNSFKILDELPKGKSHKKTKVRRSKGKGKRPRAGGRRSPSPLSLEHMLKKIRSDINSGKSPSEIKHCLVENNFFEEFKPKIFIALIQAFEVYQLKQNHPLNNLKQLMFELIGKTKRKSPWLTEEIIDAFIESGQPEMIDWFHKKGIYDYYIDTPNHKVSLLHKAILDGKNETLIKCLLSNQKVNVNLPCINETEVTCPLLLLCSLMRVKYESFDKDGISNTRILMFTASSDVLQVALKRHDLNLSVCNEEGNGALHVLINSHPYKLISEIERSAVQTLESSPDCERIIRKRQLEKLKLLLDHSKVKISIISRNHNCKTPLYMAFLENDVEAMFLILTCAFSRGEKAYIDVMEKKELGHYPHLRDTFLEGLQVHANENRHELRQIGGKIPARLGCKNAINQSERSLIINNAATFRAVSLNILDEREITSQSLSELNVQADPSRLQLLAECLNVVNKKQHFTQHVISAIDLYGYTDNSYPKSQQYCVDFLRHAINELFIIKSRAEVNNALEVLSKVSENQKSQFETVILRQKKRSILGLLTKHVLMNNAELKKNQEKISNAESFDNLLEKISQLAIKANDQFPSINRESSNRLLPAFKMMPVLSEIMDWKKVPSRSSRSSEEERFEIQRKRLLVWLLNYSTVYSLREYMEAEECLEEDEIIASSSQVTGLHYFARMDGNPSTQASSSHHHREQQAASSSQNNSKNEKKEDIGFFFRF